MRKMSSSVFTRVLLLPPDEEPWENSGVLPEASCGASGPGRMARVVHLALHPLPWTESSLRTLLFPPVGWHISRLTSQLPQCALPVHAYPWESVVKEFHANTQTLNICSMFLCFWDSSSTTCSVAHGVQQSLLMLVRYTHEVNPTVAWLRVSYFCHGSVEIGRLDYWVFFHKAYYENIIVN